MKLCSTSRNCSIKLAGRQFKTVKSKQIVNFQDLLPWDCVEAENISQLKTGLTHGQHVYKQILKALDRDVPSYTSNTMMVDAGKEIGHRTQEVSYVMHSPYIASPIIYCWRQKTGLDVMILDNIFLKFLSVSYV